MHILLINSNPVVARLLLLCTRDSSYFLDAVDDTLELSYEKYDMVFVDEDSYTQEVKTLFDNFSVGKKVFMSFSKESKDGFDKFIQKPFLPSQIIEIIEEIEADIHIEQYNKDNTSKSEIQEYIFELEEVLQQDKISHEKTSKTVEIEKEKEVIFEEFAQEGMQILDDNEIEKIKTLLDMDEELDEPKDILSDKEYEVRKISAIKEQLIAEGLEIVDEGNIVETLQEVETKKEKRKKDMSGKKQKAKSKKKTKKIKSKKDKKIKKHFELTEEYMIQLEDAIEIAVATMKKKKMRKFIKGKKIKVALKLESSSS